MLNKEFHSLSYKKRLTWQNFLNFSRSPVLGFFINRLVKNNKNDFSAKKNHPYHEKNY